MVATGCASDSVVPASLEPELDRQFTFADLQRSPGAHVGRLIVLGGEVLSAKRLKTGTQIEVLQIPLEANEEPGTDRMSSEGRFLAIQERFLDPATLPSGTRVTIVGQVSGAKQLPLDESEYTYPVLAIKSLRTWPDKAAVPYWYGPPPGPYYGGRYWYPYGPYWRPYPYWW